MNGKKKNKFECFKLKSLKSNIFNNELRKNENYF